MELDFIINRIYPLSEASLTSLKNLVSEVELPKGSIILEANKIETSVYFLKKGIVRAFAPTENNDRTFWFGLEGDIILSMKSYVQNEKSYETIELLEDSILYKIDIKSLRKLFETDIHFANWGRILAEKELVKTEELFVSRQFKSAKERYLDLLKNQPEILRRVQLGYIASYLGITQVSLSRIRAEL